jgi:hypothetical protein
MSKKIYLTLIIIIVLIVASVTAFYLFSYNKEEGPKIAVGVSVGDVFTYKMVGIADFSSGAFSIPENFFDTNNTKYYRVEITDIESPFVSYTVTLEFKNGTMFNDYGKINLKTGLYSGSPWNIYAANLTAGNLCRPGSMDEPRINSTQTKSLVAGDDRELNFLTSDYEAYDLNDQTYSTICYVYNYIYFDKQMGMMVAYRTMEMYTFPEIILMVDFELVEYTLAGADTVKISNNLNFFS